VQQRLLEPLAGGGAERDGAGAVRDGAGAAGPGRAGPLVRAVRAVRGRFCRPAPARASALARAFALARVCVLALALARVRPRGAVVLKSTYAGVFPLDPAALVVPEVRLLGSRCGPFPEALRLLRQGWVDPRPLIGRTIPLTQGIAALTTARLPAELKLLIDCGEGSDSP